MIGNCLMLRPLWPSDVLMSQALEPETVTVSRTPAGPQYRSDSESLCHGLTVAGHREPRRASPGPGDRPGLPVPAAAAAPAGPAGGRRTAVPWQPSLP